MTDDLFRKPIEDAAARFVEGSTGASVEATVQAVIKAGRVGLGRDQRIETIEVGVIDLAHIIKRHLPPIAQPVWDALAIAREVRAAQNLYFKTRAREDLIASKQAERALDYALALIDGTKKEPGG